MRLMRQQLQPWHSNELAAARRAACRVGPPGSSFFASDDILLKSIFVRKVRLGRLEMRAGAYSTTLRDCTDVLTAHGACFFACILSRPQELLGHGNFGQLKSGRQTRFHCCLCLETFVTL